MGGRRSQAKKCGLISHAGQQRLWSRRAKTEQRQVPFFLSPKRGVKFCRGNLVDGFAFESLRKKKAMT